MRLSKLQADKKQVEDKIAANEAGKSEDDIKVYENSIEGKALLEQRKALAIQINVNEDIIDTLKNYSESLSQNPDFPQFAEAKKNDKSPIEFPTSKSEPIEEGTDEYSQISLRRSKTKALKEFGQTLSTLSSNTQGPNLNYSDAMQMVVGMSQTLNKKVQENDQYIQDLVKAKDAEIKKEFDERQKNADDSFKKKHDKWAEKNIPKIKKLEEWNKELEAVKKKPTPSQEKYAQQKAVWQGEKEAYANAERARSDKLNECKKEPGNILRAMGGLAPKCDLPGLPDVHEPEALSTSTIQNEKSAQLGAFLDNNPKPEQPESEPQAPKPETESKEAIRWKAIKQKDWDANRNAPAPKDTVLQDVFGPIESPYIKPKSPPPEKAATMQPQGSITQPQEMDALPAISKLRNVIFKEPDGITEEEKAALEERKKKTLYAVGLMLSGKENRGQYGDVTYAHLTPDNIQELKEAYGIDFDNGKLVTPTKTPKSEPPKEMTEREFTFIHGVSVASEGGLGDTWPVFEVFDAKKAEVDPNGNPIDKKLTEEDMKTIREKYNFDFSSLAAPPMSLDRAKAKALIKSTFEVTDQSQGRILQMEADGQIDADEWSELAAKEKALRARVDEMLANDGVIDDKELDELKKDYRVDLENATLLPKAATE